MPNHKLTYEVGTDTSDAVRDLRKLGDAGKDAGKDLSKGLADGFEDAESAGTKALTALGSKLDDLESEVKGTASAVKAIGAELGDGFDSSRIEGMVGDLRRMGVSFDEIEAKAKEFADVVQRADGIKLDAVNSGLTNVGTNLERVGTEGDQSRSVLANLAGNAAQDLGELGGVVGTLGVGIGQLAEYAVDGNIQLSNLAKVAGPMAGLAAATALVSAAMNAVNTERAFKAKLVEDFTDSLREGATAVEHLRDIVTETGELSFETGLFGGGGLLGLSSETRDLIPLLNTLGISYDQFLQIVQSDDPGAFFENLKDKFLDLALAAEDDAVADQYQAQAEAARDAKVGVDAYVTAMHSAATTQGELDQFIGGTAASLADLNDQFAKIRGTDPFSQFQTTWAAVLNDMRDGEADFTATGTRIEFLADKLGLTNEEVLQLIDAKLDEELEAQAEAAQKTGESFKDAADGVGGYADAVAEAKRIMDSADFDAAGVEAAGNALRDWFSSDFWGNQNGIASTQEALDNLFASVDEHGPLWQDAEWLMGPEGREQLGLIQQLGDTYLPQIQQAFDDADGSQDAFRGNMHRVGETIKTQLIGQYRALGYEFDDAEAAANDLMIKMGLIPRNVDTMYTLMGTEDAKAKLGLLQSSITALPDEVQIRIGAAIAQGDFTAALGIAQAAFSGGVYAPVHADLGPFQKDVQNLRNNMKYATPIPIPARMQLGSTSIGRGTGQTAGQSVEPAAAGYGVDAASAGAYTVPSTPAVTVAGGGSTLNVNLTVQAAVISNRFELDRLVRRSVANGVRLAGVR